MIERRDFEAIREIRARSNTAKDEAIVNLSARAMTHVKNILRHSQGTDQTTAYHAIAQKYEKLDAALERLNESIQFLSESHGDLKGEWEASMAIDAGSAREALFALLSSCESLDKEDVSRRINSESQTLGKIVNGMEKIKNRDPMSCATFEKLSIEFEQSLMNLDNIFGGTTYPADEFDAYSKFSGDLEDLGERIRRLKESLRFFEDEHTKEDWKYFMELDLKRLRESIKTSYDSSMWLVNAAA